MTDNEKQEFVLKIAQTQSQLEHKAFTKIVSVFSKSLRGAKHLSNKHTENHEICLIYQNGKLLAFRCEFQNEWSPPALYFLE